MSLAAEYDLYLTRPLDSPPPWPLPDHALQRYWSHSAHDANYAAIGVNLCAHSRQAPQRAHRVATQKAQRLTLGQAQYVDAAHQRVDLENDHGANQAEPIPKGRALFWQ